MAIPTVREFGQLANAQARDAQTAILAAKGTTDNNIYPLTIDPLTGAIAVTVGGIAPETYLGMTVNYPSDVQEVYLFYSDAAKTTLIGTVTVDYSDATKVRVTSAVRT